MNPIAASRIITLVFALVHLCFAFVGDEVYSIGFRALALSFLVVLYILKVKKRNNWFLGFLAFYAIGDAFSFVSWFTNTEQSADLDLVYYYVGNSVYIIAYLLLIIRIALGLNFKEILKKHMFYVLLLGLLNVFCVYFISDATTEFIDSSSHLMEDTYNAIIVILMSFSVLGYLAHDDQKSIKILIGSMLIVFSEILQLAYFYVADFNVLYVICSILFTLAFLFFYLQSRLEYRLRKEYTYEL